jgi:hypothetical protein
MALPFILWGAAALLAGTGVVKGIGAVSDFDDAKSIGESARRRYEAAETSLQKSRDKTNSKFKALGEVKVSIFKNQINHLVTAIKKSKHASSKLNDFNVSISADELKEMERLVLTSLEIERGLGTGAVTGALAAWGAYGSVGLLATASTGTAISTLSGVAATNATLAWLGGGALSTGGFGMAGGTLALGGIVLGPALAVGGFMLASKAEKALTQAHEYQAEVDIAIAEMDKMKIVLLALQANAKEVGNVLSQMAKRFDAIKVNDDSNSEAFNQMMIVGKGLKSLLDIAIMEQDGGASKNIKSKVSGYLEI